MNSLEFYKKNDRVFSYDLKLEKVNSSESFQALIIEIVNLLNHIKGEAENKEYSNLVMKIVLSQKNIVVCSSAIKNYISTPILVEINEVCKQQDSDHSEESLQDTVLVAKCIGLEVKRFIEINKVELKHKSLWSRLVFIIKTLNRIEKRMLYFKVMYSFLILFCFLYKDLILNEHLIFVIVCGLVGFLFIEVVVSLLYREIINSLIIVLNLMQLLILCLIFAL